MTQSASLNRMSVPFGSSASDSNQGLLMPKLRYRYRVFFYNLGVSQTTQELTKQVVSFARPNLTFEEIALPIYNSTIKLAGRHSWADVSCEIRDDASGQVSKLIGEQMQKQMDFLEMSSASSGIDYKFTTVLEVLDGGNGTTAFQVLESWELMGCYLKAADYGPMNYGSNEAAAITLTIAYDNAAQSGLNGTNGTIGFLTGDVLGRTAGGEVGGVATGAGQG
jgi:hypothetical protein